MEKEKINKLYPILHKGKLMYEKDCDNIFTQFYHDRVQLELSYDNYIYITDNEYINPEGDWLKD